MSEGENLDFSREYLALPAPRAEQLMRREIPPADIAVYVALYSHCGKEWIAWPKAERLAAMTGVSKRRVLASLVRLRVAGWVEEVGRTSGGVVKYRLAEVTSASPQGGRQRHLRGDVSVTQKDKPKKDKPKKSPPTPQGGVGGVDPDHEGTRSEVELAWLSLSSWSRDNAPAGHDRFRAALTEILGRPALPRGADAPRLVLAWLDRLQGTEGFRGITNPAAWLISQARKRDAGADALAYAEALEAGRKKRVQPRAPPETEQVDISALERISSRQASPTTTRQRRQAP